MRLPRNTPELLRSHGLTVVEVNGWETRGTQRNNGELMAINAIMWHHTGVRWSGTARSVSDYPSLKLIRDGRLVPDPVPGPLSQFGMGYSGTVYVIASGLANHAGNGAGFGLRGSYDTLGIEMESPGDGTWTSAQRRAMPVLGAALTLITGCALHIAHREWAPARKIDPFGISMPMLRADIKTLIEAWRTIEMATEQGKSLDLYRRLSDGAVFAASPGNWQYVDAAMMTHLLSAGYVIPRLGASDEALAEVRKFYMRMVPGSFDVYRRKSDGRIALTPGGKWRELAANEWAVLRTGAGYDEPAESLTDLDFEVARSVYGG